jgi:hypothetical protein
VQEVDPSDLVPTVDERGAEAVNQRDGRIVHGGAS